MPKVSVIVPVYNAEEFLSRCIESIQRQIENDIEIILVDDESSDNSLQICHKYADSDGRIMVFPKKNGGPHSARIVGINNANSSFVAFVDADDWISESYISNMLSDMEANSADCIIGGYTLCSKQNDELCINNISTGYYNKEILKAKIYSQMLCPSKSFQQNITPALWAKLFKTSYLKEVMNSLDEDIRIGEDLACTYKYILISNGIFIDNNICDYNYCIIGESNTNRYDEKYFEKAMRSSAFLYKTINELGYSLLKENIDRYRLYQLYRQIGILINAENSNMKKIMINDIENASQMSEYQEVFQCINIHQLMIPAVERYLLLCLSRKRQCMFHLICTVLYWNAKRKRQK